jgi:ketosteroid isomerase-like protein
VTLSTGDRLDILDLLARADNAATRRDTAAYISYFTDDAVLDGAKGEHRGKVALAHAVGPIWEGEGPATTHLTLNAIIDSVDGHPEQATATSTLVILDSGPSFGVRHVATIVQRLEKVDQVWRISRRSVSA